MEVPTAEAIDLIKIDLTISPTKQKVGSLLDGTLDQLSAIARLWSPVHFLDELPGVFPTQITWNEQLKSCDIVTHDSIDHWQKPGKLGEHAHQVCPTGVEVSEKMVSSAKEVALNMEKRYPDPRS